MMDYITTKERMTKVFNTEEVDWTKQPMFFGAEPNTQRFDQQRYPISFDLVFPSLNNHTIIITGIITIQWVS